jgi:hypothetical protein
MAVRAYWKGSLKLSLVSCPVLLYPATTTVDKTRFHMINKETGNRLKQQDGRCRDRRARGKASQCHQPDGCAAAKPEGQGIGKAIGAFPGAPDDAPPRKKSAPLGGAGAQGELALKLFHFK